MSEDREHDQQERKDHDNLTRLLNLGRRKKARVNRRYSFVVRSLRLLFPLAALIIVAIVIAWPKMEDDLTPIPKKDIIPQTTGRNELINPRFESANASMQPYVITAARAEQAIDDIKKIILSGPVANVTLSPGSIIEAEAEHGLYSQTDETLRLEGDVRLRHSNGYIFESAALDIAMGKRVIDSHDPVTVYGPDATIEAIAMHGDGETGVLVFKGPTKLILTRKGKELLQ